MKIHILLKIARQVEGEYVFVNVEKASTKKEVIHSYLMENNSTLPRTEIIRDIDCVIEYGVLEDVIITEETSTEEVPAEEVPAEE